MNKGEVALVGLPRTGKSTYLGAIWQIVQDPNDENVVERDVTGDRSYLQEIGDKVARGEEIGRSQTSSLEGMRLKLGFPEGDREISVPDLGGETLRLLVEDRTWHPRLKETIETADAILLFIHPERVSLPISIAMANEILRGLQLGVSASAEGMQEAEQEGEHSRAASSEAISEEAGTVELPKFDPKSACTAAKYIDALENILVDRRLKWPIRVAIVISAWDSVDGDPTPESWLNDNLPALSAFVQANADMLQWKLFGVSAQGGKLPDCREELLARGGVRERCYAKDSSGATVSLVEPLRWALWG